MRKQLLLAVAALLVSSSACFADYISTVKDGNKAFQEKDYKKALECYRQAEPDLPVSPELDYNIGGALSGGGEYDEAIKKFQTALKSTDIKVQAEAQYNLGNTYYRKKDYQNAITAFQESLKLNPTDMDAKFNLELARKMLKENIKPQQNKQDKQDKQQQDQKNQQQQQQNKDDQKDQQNKQKQDQQNQDQQNQDKQNQQQKQQQGQAKKMSKEDAERILNAMKDDEQDIQKRIRRADAKSDYVGKDW